MDNRPIGVFDSGLGGLTAVKQLIKLAPNESIVFLGDTGRAPYGMKDEETLIQYGKQDAEFLINQDVKMVVAACGTISSVFGKNNINLEAAPFTGVLLPAAVDALKASKTKRIGVIGTAATINSKSFPNTLKSLDSEVEIFDLACPLFVPLVEYGFVTDKDPITILTVERYLQYFKDKNIDTLVLGCTHYPLLTSFISNYMGSEVTLIDAGLSTASFVLDTLKEKNMLSDNQNKGNLQFYVTDSPKNFRTVAHIFLGQDIGDMMEQTVL